MQAGGPLQQFIVDLMLATLRFLPLFSVAGFPYFTKLPSIAKLSVILGLAFPVSLSGFAYDSGKYANLLGVTLLAMQEVLIGLFFVFGIMASTAAIRMVGHVLDMQVGFSAAAIVNPQTNQSDSIIGTILIMLFTFLLFEWNVHHQLLQAVFLSFEQAPVGQAINHLQLQPLLSLLSGQFVLAIGLVFPVMIVIFSLDVTIGVLSKSMPQANIYFVALPLKIFIGLLILTLSMTHFAPGFEHFIHQISAFWQLLLG